MNHHQTNHGYNPYYYDPLPDIAKFFKEKNALSAEKAVKVESIDWAAMGMTHAPDRKYRFIKKTEEDKYWIDTEELAEFIKKPYFMQTGIHIILIAIFLAFLFVAIYFAIQYYNF